MIDNPASRQRQELGTFLSTHRARLKPSDFGFPTGSRRTPGLRREEVAVLAGVSVSWYTWIEQGRDIQASVEALKRIAGVFRLDRVETAHLLALASRASPVLTESEAPSSGLKLLVQAMDPIPAYIRNRRLDILAWNDAICDLFVDYASLLPRERNTLRLLFLYLPYRELILDWEQMARGMISTFRASRAQVQDKAPFDRIVEELMAESPEFRTWWPEVDVKGFEEGCKCLRHPRRGHIAFTYVALAPEGQPDLSLVTYLPHAVRQSDGE